MFIPALVSHCELSKWAGPEVGYLFLEQQPRQRTDVCRRRNKRPKSEETAGEEKKEMRGGERKKTPEAFSLWISYLLFANKVGWECFKLAEGLLAKQLHQRLPPTCCSGVPGTAPLDPGRDAARESCSVSFSSQTPGFPSLPRFVSAR